MPAAPVTCCRLTLLQRSEKFPAEEKQAQTLRIGPFGPPVWFYCATVCKNKSETGTPHRRLQSFGFSALLLVFHLKPFMQNHHFATSKQERKARRGSGSRPDAGRRHLPAPATTEGPVEVSGSHPTMQLFSASTYRGRCN